MRRICKPIKKCILAESALANANYTYKVLAPRGVKAPLLSFYSLLSRASIFSLARNLEQFREILPIAADGFSVFPGVSCPYRYSGQGQTLDELVAGGKINSKWRPRYSAGRESGRGSFCQDDAYQ